MSQPSGVNPSTEAELANANGWRSKLIFLFIAFVLAVVAFYGGLALNVFSTPYLESQIGVPMFTGFLGWAFGFAFVSTVMAIGCLSPLIAQRIRAWHYALLPIPFAIEFAVSWFFFIGFFGI